MTTKKAPAKRKSARDPAQGLRRVVLALVFVMFLVSGAQGYTINFVRQESRAGIWRNCVTTNETKATVQDIVGRYNAILLSAAAAEPPIGETPEEKARRDRITAAFKSEVGKLLGELNPRDCGPRP